MMTTRAAIARRLFRGMCFLWLLLVPVGQVARLPYLQPPWREATWLLSLGALALVWVGIALWSGVVQLGYRGIGSRLVARSEAAPVFWWHIAIGTGFGVVLVWIGIVRLLHLT
jgi:hypothetical protein